MFDATENMITKRNIALKSGEYAKAKSIEKITLCVSMLL